jgi:hypothetical protein
LYVIGIPSQTNVRNVTALDLSDLHQYVKLLKFHITTHHPLPTLVLLEVENVVLEIPVVHLSHLGATNLADLPQDSTLLTDAGPQLPEPDFPEPAEPPDDLSGTWWEPWVVRVREEWD